MAPTKLQMVKRQLKDAQDELHRIKKKPQQRSPSARAKLVKAPQIGEFWLPLIVGPNQTRINIHSNMAPLQTLNYLDTRRMANCPIFIALPEQCPDMLELYRLYLYKDQVYSQSPGDADGDDELVAMNPDAEWQRLKSMYFLGLELRDERFANKVVDAIIDKVEEDPEERIYPTGLASDVFVNTVEGDRLRKLIVDLHVWIAHGEGIEEPHEDAHGPDEFLRNVIMTMRAYVEDAPSPWETNLCKNYYKHDKTLLCAAEGAEVIDLTDV